MPVNRCFSVNYEIYFVIVWPCFYDNISNEFSDIIFTMTFYFCILREWIIITFYDLKWKSFLLFRSFTTLKHYLVFLLIKTNDRVTSPLIEKFYISLLMIFYIIISKIFFQALSCFIFLNHLFIFSIPISFLDFILNLNIPLSWFIIKQGLIFTIWIRNIQSIVVNNIHLSIISLFRIIIQIILVTKVSIIVV